MSKAATTKKQKVPAKPCLDILPDPGSPRRPCLETCTCKYCAYWRELEKRRCRWCNLLLGESWTHWILVHEDGAVEHEACFQDLMEIEHAFLALGSITDGVAKKLKMTQEGVKAMPRYERERYAKEIIAVEYPDWEERALARLQDLRRKPKAVENVPTPSLTLMQPQLDFS